MSVKSGIGIPYSLSFHVEGLSSSNALGSITKVVVVAVVPARVDDNRLAPLIANGVVVGTGNVVGMGVVVVTGVVDVVAAGTVGFT